MRFWEIVRIASDSILAHKMRAILTVLGIIIGVGAVVAMVAIGTGAQKAIESQIASLGTNFIMIFPGVSTTGGVSGGAGSMASLTEDDIAAIKEQAPAVLAITPATRAGRQVIAGNLNWFTSIQGCNPEYFTIRDWKLSSGDVYTDQDVRGATKVCVIGQTVADNIFPDQDPIGQTMRIGNLPFKVLGVLAAKGQNSMGQDQDDIVIAPFSTVQKRITGEDHVRNIFLSAVSKDAIPTAQAQIKEILRARHRLQDYQDDDFNMRTQTEIATAFTATSKTMSWLLASIASVSLIVGGIGIMNIMLVSVTERTREIGIRKSLGARRNDILQQFLFEAIALSLLGGLIGISLGAGASGIISKFAGWPVQVTPASVAMAFGFSAAVGMFFGYYPARKAATLDPIESLRYE
jgi:putative ABC transport system permease protein